jgi:hypothetical protein
LLCLLAIALRSGSRADYVGFEIGDEGLRERLVGWVRSVGRAGGAAFAAGSDQVAACCDLVSFVGYLVALIGDFGAVSRRCVTRL